MSYIQCVGSTLLLGIWNIPYVDQCPVALSSHLLYFCIFQFVASDMLDVRPREERSSLCRSQWDLAPSLSSGYLPHQRMHTPRWGVPWFYGSILCYKCSLGILQLCRRNLTYTMLPRHDPRYISCGYHTYMNDIGINLEKNDQIHVARLSYRRIVIPGKSRVEKSIIVGNHL
jgi:hypothetical protein